MLIQIKAVNEHPLLSCRVFDILRDGERVGTFSKGRDGRWNAQLSRERDGAYQEFDRRAYHGSNFHAMIRLIACYLVGDVDRIPYLQRGIWTNPCPVAEILQ